MLKCFLTAARDPNKLSATRFEIRQYAEEHVSFEAVTAALKRGFNSLNIPHA